MSNECRWSLFDCECNIHFLEILKIMFICSFLMGHLLFSSISWNNGRRFLRKECDTFVLIGKWNHFERNWRRTPWSWRRKRRCLIIRGSKMHRTSVSFLTETSRLGWTMRSKGSQRLMLFLRNYLNSVNYNNCYIYIQWLDIKITNLNTCVRTFQFSIN